MCHVDGKCDLVSSVRSFFSPLGSSFMHFCLFPVVIVVADLRSLLFINIYTYIHNDIYLSLPSRFRLSRLMPLSRFVCTLCCRCSKLSETGRTGGVYGLCSGCPAFLNLPSSLLSTLFSFWSLTSAERCWERFGDYNDDEINDDDNDDDDIWTWTFMPL